MSTHDQDQEEEIETEMDADPTIVANREEAEEADQFATWANSPMGKKVVAPIKKDVEVLLKQLFHQAEGEPTLNGLLATIAQLDAKMKVLKQFSGAKNKAKLLYTILEENQSEFKSRRA